MYSEKTIHRLNGVKLLSSTFHKSYDNMDNILLFSYIPLLTDPAECCCCSVSLCLCEFSSRTLTDEATTALNKDV